MIVVTGATGQLGRLVVEGLLKKIPAADTDTIAIAVRDAAKAADLAERGVQVRVADYDDPASLVKAFTGANELLLISSNTMGRRVAQHEAAINAAKRAGVSHLVYTSVLNADTTTLALAAEHLETERLIHASGLPFTLLRNGWYTENYASAIGQGVELGFFSGSAGDGRVASATRADYADAAVEALTGENHAGKTYELSGDTSWSYAELAAALTEATGKDVEYRDLPAEKHHEVLLTVGLPAALVDNLVDFDRAIAHGDLAATPGDLHTLIGRPTTPLSTTIHTLLTP